MKRIAIIGAGISGLAAANCLKNSFDVTVFEADKKVGGLIKCDRVDGNLYHMVGGHVFNSRRNDVLEWFWNFFDKEKEFTKSTRYATIFLDKHVDYPIENHIYQLEPEIIQEIISDLILLIKASETKPANFEDFLKSRFGETLYNLYFKPYNEKIWKRDLSSVPLTWLEGKLPMPTIEEILYNNFQREKEMTMVHSSFYYPKINGSQFLADRLSEGLKIVNNTTVEKIIREENGQYKINDANDRFDIIIYTGNVKELPATLRNSKLDESIVKGINNLEYHGTTTVLCKMEPLPYSWIYLPSPDYLPHRIICTGNFAESNNSGNNKTVTVEFTDYHSKEDILFNLRKLPYSLEYIKHKHTEFTYPIQNISTRELINDAKLRLEDDNLFLLGRFAEWEYYNMDAAIGAAIDLSKKLLS